MTLQTPLATERVARFAAREQIFRRTASVLLAVSGGADSTAALLLMRELRTQFGYEITVAHFDHQLREGSRQDLEAVRELCTRLDVPFVSGEGDVRAVATRNRAGLEETARTMRYQFLAFVAAERRIEAVATGHTADDQAETVLLRILRGTGVRGLRGMLPSGPIPGAPAQRLVRPLLAIGHSEAVAICAEAGVAPLRDSTNDDPTFARNRLRHETLPALRVINPSVRESLVHLAANAREAFAETERRSYLAQPRERLPVGSIFAAETLRDLPSEARTLVVEREAAFLKLHVDVNRTRLANLQSILERGSGQVAFGDVLVELSCGSARIGPQLAFEPLEPKAVNVPGTTAAGPWSLTASLDELRVNPGERLATVDLTAVTGVLRVRSLALGDRIRYHGSRRKASDLLADARVPVWERRGAIVIADRDRVQSILVASNTFAADAAGDNPLWIRLRAR